MPQPAPRERSAIFPRSRPQLAMKAPGKLTREGNPAVRLWPRSRRDGLAQCIRKIVETTNQLEKKGLVLPTGRPAPPARGSQSPSSIFWEFPDASDAVCEAPSYQGARNAPPSSL